MHEMVSRCLHIIVKIDNLLYLAFLRNTTILYIGPIIDDTTRISP